MTTRPRSKATSIVLYIVLLFLLIVPLAAFYFIIFYASIGQTPGKMAVGIRVVPTVGTGIPPGRAFLRCVGYLVSALPLATGFLWMVLDRRHRCWHDTLALTKVIVISAH